MPEDASRVTFRARRRAAVFSWIFDEDTEITGEARVRLWISAAEDAPLSLFAGLSKWTAGRFVAFEGSYGFGRDYVATGSRRVLATREPQLVEIDLAPSATLFRAGDELRLHIGGRQLSPRNPLWGSFPALYRSSPRVMCTVHVGPEHPAALELPITSLG